MSSISPCILLIAIFLSFGIPPFISLNKAAILELASETASVFPSLIAAFKALISFLNSLRLFFIAPTSKPDALSSANFSVLVIAGLTFTTLSRDFSISATFDIDVLNEFSALLTIS